MMSKEDDLEEDCVNQLEGLDLELAFCNLGI